MLQPVTNTPDFLSQDEEDDTHEDLDGSSKSADANENDKMTKMKVMVRKMDMKKKIMNRRRK